ncbi:hypothetical protein C7B67_16440 [filamentous cyanobacterium Phorm 6]|nr:hypothetical protein C7B67_16440 [filamentous cyanobacterium Phorm 6]
MQLKVHKFTVTETIFLAATLTAASLTTLEVTPKVIKSVGKQSAIVQAEIKKKKLVDPRNAFSMGFLVGGSVGALATIKVIAAKINGYP